MKGPVAADAIATAYIGACLAEIEALKPGNVHVFADGHQMTVADFVRSATLSAAPLTRRGASVGARIRGAVEATLGAVGCNTNLGIVLLAAPLAVAAEAGRNIRAHLATVLDRLDESDAADAFAAIRLAGPGGLGSADEYDVSGPPGVALGVAMAAASARDRIAMAYATRFDDVFEVGLPALARARARGLEERWCTSAVYLEYLTRFPDTHVARKFGPGRAEEVRRQAATLLQRIDLGEVAVAPLLAFDADLKREGLNPGTSADFTVATLFVDRLGGVT